MALQHMPTLADVLARKTRHADLYDRLPDGRLRCYACGHCCPLPDGAVGVCKVRFNQGGQLFAPWGYVGGVQCDPIETIVNLEGAWHPYWTRSAGSTPWDSGWKSSRCSFQASTTALTSSSG